MAEARDRTEAELSRLHQLLIDEYPDYITTVPVESAELGTYDVHLRWPPVVPLVRAGYSAADIAELRAVTEQATRIEVADYPHGTFVLAADTDPDRAERTNYDAVWVRDSLWGFLSLRIQPERRDDANRVLLTLLDYLASQRDRMRRAIEHPELVTLPGNAGEQDAVHIRFDPSSPSFDDVRIDGVVQPWSHKQNDALGLLLDVAAEATLGGEVSYAELSADGRVEAIALLVGYLEAVRFAEMEDSGAWEELPRLNASSIGLVVSGLERVLALAAREAAFATALFDVVPEDRIAAMIDRGYEALAASLAAGGESPLYPADDPRHRTADAALLCLIYPARLARLDLAQKSRVLEIVDSLVRPDGIIRYRGDNYQSANFWFHEIATDTSSESHAKREQAFIPDTEAEWFFDSWAALCHLLVHAETADPVSLARAAKHLSRSLGQISPDGRMLGADGDPVPPLSLPESYNHVILAGADFVLPSPIAPLNWSKATLKLALHRYAAVLDADDPR